MWLMCSMVMMATAHKKAASNAMHSPAPRRKPPPFRASIATPPTAIAAHSRPTALGRIRCRADSSSGTRIIARFSSRETVPACAVLRASISHLITRKKRKPTSAPPKTVQRSSLPIIFLPSRANSSINASKNRAARILKAPMVLNPILLNTKEVLQAMIAAVISTSAFLSDIFIPPRYRVILPPYYIPHRGAK